MITESRLRISECKDRDIHLEHGAEGGPGVGGGRGGPEPDHGATGAGTLGRQTKPANPDPERPTRRRACCNSYLIHFSHVSIQLAALIFTSIGIN